MSLQVFLSIYGWIGAFIAAATPISGNLIYIILGLSKYRPWKFATALFGGELLYNEGPVEFDPAEEIVRRESKITVPDRNLQ